MLSHLKQRIIAVLAQTAQAALATSGAAGLQISVCPYLNDELKVFVRLHSQSEHLVNLETQPDIVMTADGWRLFGVACAAVPESVPLAWQTGQSAWSQVIEIAPSRFEFIEPDGANIRETIDID